MLRHELLLVFISETSDMISLGFVFIYSICFRETVLGVISSVSWLGQLTVTQARRQKKLQDLMKMSR